jgi:hypothetical protein
MSSVAVRYLLGTACAVLAAAPAAAQEGLETRVTLTVSPTFVDFAGFGGGFGALAAQLQVSRYFSANVGGEVTAFAIVPGGKAVIDVACPVGATNCASRSTPSMLSGFLTSAFGFLGGTGFRASAGVGGVKADGGEGLPVTTSLAGALGLDWVSQGNSRWSPTVGIRAVRLARPIAGARNLVLPGVGLTF